VRKLLRKYTAKYRVNTRNANIFGKCIVYLCTPAICIRNVCAYLPCGIVDGRFNISHRRKMYSRSSILFRLIVLDVQIFRRSQRNGIFHDHVFIWFNIILGKQSFELADNHHMKNMFYFLFLICNMQSFSIYIMLNNNIKIKLSA